jgi:hypothetical protein
MKRRLAIFFAAACSLTCTSAADDTDSAESVMASCDVDPAGVTVQYRCDSTATSGQCVDYIEGFDTSTMDATCDGLSGVATLGEACSVASSLGRCCSVLNTQWYVTHYADGADAPLSAGELQTICETSGSVWFP